MLRDGHVPGLAENVPPNAPGEAFDGPGDVSSTGTWVVLRVSEGDGGTLFVGSLVVLEVLETSPASSASGFGGTGEGIVYTTRMSDI